MGKHEEAHKEHINKYKMAHMIGVAEYMRERASDYNKGYYKDPTTFCREPVPIQIDPEEAYVVGLLHDIGYIYERGIWPKQKIKKIKKDIMSEMKIKKKRSLVL